MNSLGVMLWGTILKITWAVRNSNWVILSNLKLKHYLSNPLRVNSLGVMIWGTSLEIDISKVQYGKG